MLPHRKGDLSTLIPLSTSANHIYTSNAIFGPFRYEQRPKKFIKSPRSAKVVADKSLFYGLTCVNIDVGMLFVERANDAREKSTCPLRTMWGMDCQDGLVDQK
uniref:Ovule protein n=1 Tax=Steinernema glaseri TaxID=37863 RepID=A0A1I7YNW5_9BILA